MVEMPARSRSAFWLLVDGLNKPIEISRPAFWLLVGGLALALLLAWRISAGEEASVQAVVGVGLLVLLGLVGRAADRRSGAAVRSTRDQTIMDWLPVPIALVIGLMMVQADASHRGTKLLVLLGIVGLAYGATMLARILDDYTRGAGVPAATNKPEVPIFGHAIKTPRPSTLDANFPNNKIPGVIMIAGDRVHLRTKYGDIKLRDDAAEKVKWIAELNGASREAEEQRGGKASVEQPTALLRDKVMERESGACAWVLMDPRRVQLVCATLADRLAEVKPGLSCDAVVAPAYGGVIIGHEFARQLGVPIVVGEVREQVVGEVRVKQFTPQQVFEFKGSQVVVVDDTINKGDTIRACINYVNDNEGEVLAAACLVDRRKVEGVEVEVEGEIEGRKVVAFWTGSSQLRAHTREVDPGDVGSVTPAN